LQPHLADDSDRADRIVQKRQEITATIVAEPTGGPGKRRGLKSSRRFIFYEMKTKKIRS
jgi:hypothetical protein